MTLRTEFLSLFRKKGGAMRNVMAILVVILFFVVGYANAGCAIDSPIGTQVNLGARRADAFSVVDIGWENEQMINGVEHLIKVALYHAKKRGKNNFSVRVEVFIR